MSKKICAVGCPLAKILYTFPVRGVEEDRRKLWLKFFDMEEPYRRDVYACDRHFSAFQYTKHGLKRNAVPDIPVVDFSTPNQLPIKRKTKNLRENVIVLTPRDPEYIAYRNKTGVFNQNLFDLANNRQMPPSPSLQPKSILQIPIIKSVSCSMLTQTNTRLCGSVEVSEFLDEFRLNCFYCSETFALEIWSKFVDHLKVKHFEQEEAFKMTKYISEDHDYTPVQSPPSSPITQRIKANITAEPLIIIPPPPPEPEPPIIDVTEDNPSPTLTQPPPSIPSLNSTPKPTASKTNDKSEDKPVDLNLANKLIKLLDETVLNPSFRRTEEDNIVVIKRKVVETLQSNFLSKIIEEEAKPSTSSGTRNSNCVNKKSQLPSSSMPTSSSSSSTKFTRPLYTLNYGQQNVVSVRSTPTRVAFRKIARKRKPTITDADIPLQDFEVHNIEENPVTSYLAQPNLNKRSKSFAKRIAQQAIKNITNFENVYQTVKTRPPKVPSSGVFYVKDINSNKITEMQTSNKTPLSRCLRRATGLESVFTPMSIEDLQQNPTELVFEYSPPDVINSLLDNMKHYPVLWEFHYMPFDVNYSSAITELCKIINTEWSINLSPWKMRSSVNRILKFYRYMLPCEDIDKFPDYFDNCSLFLPSSVEEIPRARCLKCYICFKKDSELRQHLVAQHEFLKWPYKCDHCPERFLDVEDYELHKSLPHYVEIFKCQQCNKRFNRRGLYNKHKSLHERNNMRRTNMGADTENTDGIDAENTDGKSAKYVCKICHKEYTKPSSLRFHQVFHGEKKFKCHLCPKSYYIKSYLKWHIMNHNNELNYVCEICGKRFARSMHLSNHMSTHTGEKVSCSICNIKLRKSSLSRHRRLVHLAVEGTVESTHRARSHRYNKFITKKVLKRTREKGPRQYDCKICNLPFERLKLLKDHNKLVHNNVEVIPCKICHITFRQKHNLKVHYREKHKLHLYQIYKLVDENEEVTTVLAMTHEEAEAVYQAEVEKANRLKAKIKNEEESVTSADYFEQDKAHSNVLQDEIIKAVQNIDNQEIQVDDEHSMHDYFHDLVKHP